MAVFRRAAAAGCRLLSRASSSSASGGVGAGIAGRASPLAGRALSTAACTAARVGMLKPQGGISILPGVSGSAGRMSGLLCPRFMSSVPAYDPLEMPSLSPTMTQGNIVKWVKKEGDTVAPGDILCEVETDKATVEWEAQEDGVIAKILVPEGTKDIPCGTLVAIIVEEGTDISAFANFTPGEDAEAPPAPASPASEKPAEPAASSGKSYPAHLKLEMPSLSPTMEQGTISEWKKKVGDAVAAGDSLAMIETDKASMDWESQDDGYLAKILVQPGTDAIKVGTLVAVMVDDEGDIAAFEDYTGEESAAPEAAAPAAEPAADASPSAKPDAPAQRTVASGPRIIASPLAKRMAREANVSLEGAAGSGPGGRIIAEDVQELIKSGGGKAKSSAPTSADGPAMSTADFGGLPPYEDIPVSQIKKITASRLLESKRTIPHYYLSVDCKVDNMMSLRSQLNKSLEAQGIKISVNDFVIKAAAAALMAVPEVNASWQGDFIRQYKSVDMSVAVQTDVGLMVPIVKDADRKGLAAISADVQRLAAKAKEGKLAPAEFMGGTFTISNLGMFGIKSFSAIINPPQACILAIGGADKKVVMGSDGQFKEETVVNVTLSCDHRVVDGAVGATWLKAFKGYIENPLTLML
eukprot:jgi/Tetstr1/446826/TSEL_034306.t1